MIPRPVGTTRLIVSLKMRAARINPDAGVSESALIDALLQPMTQMSSWMTQHHLQSGVTQMTEWMTQQIAQDIRVAQYGAMTDMHVFGGAVMNGMMGNGNGNNGFGGMMNGHGMMGGMMGGGMMGGWNNTPNVNATPVPSTQKLDREIQLTARNFQFDRSNSRVSGHAQSFGFLVLVNDKRNFAICLRRK